MASRYFCGSGTVLPVFLEPGAPPPPAPARVADEERPVRRVVFPEAVRSWSVSGLCNAVEMAELLLTLVTPERQTISRAEILRHWLEQHPYSTRPRRTVQGDSRGSIGARQVQTALSRLGSRGLVNRQPASDDANQAGEELTVTIPNITALAEFTATHATVESDPET